MRSMEAPWRREPVKTLLVDLDGTLLGSRDTAVRAEFTARALWRIRKHGGLKAAARSLKAIRKALEGESADRALTNAERASLAFARESGLDPGRADQVLRQEVSAIFPLMKRHFFPIEGAREFIEWARPRYRLILATNPVWPLEQVLLRLSWSGIDPSVFESITHSDRMHACKPSEAYYRELLEQEGLDASECALVGDDVRKDGPAERVGISVFILSPQTRRSYGELKALLTGIIAGEAT